MSELKTYRQLAFEATIVKGFTESNLLGISGTGVYYDTGDTIKKFENEHKALSYVFSTLDFSTKYDFYDVFYNPSYEKQKDDNLKYNNYILCIVRKTHATHNQLFNYLTSPSDNSGELTEELETLDDTVERDLSKVKGLGLNIIMQDKKDDEYDIRDNFIYQLIESPVTIDIIFNKLREVKSKIRTAPDVVVIDVTGSDLKSTITDNIVIDDTVDIYREFFGGTTKTEEEIDEDVTPDPQPDMPNDDTYI